MRILLIEDEQEDVDALREGLAHLEVELEVAVHAESALEAGSQGDFDLIICDLKLPASAEAQEPRKAHGIRVFDEMRVSMPGTPVVIFSGHAEVTDLQDRLSDAPIEDHLGTGLQRMVTHRAKDDLPELVELITQLSGELEYNGAHIELSGAALGPLSEADQRVLRIHTRRRGGVVADVEPLPGGRSSASTLRVRTEAVDGRVTSRVVVKLSSIENVDDEEGRYERFVAPLLDAATYSNRLDVVRAGAFSQAGLFYSLGAMFNRSLFGVLAQDDESAARVVNQLCGNLEPWYADAPVATSSLGDVRRSLVPEAELAAMALPDDVVDDGLEAGTVHIRKATAHCDLHGGNVLVDPQARPLLIDFANVALASGCIDPISLELSPCFHPDSTLGLGTWPSEEQALNWHDADAFLRDCPRPEFLRSCRAWLQSVKRGDRERDACLYSYALSQLAYPIARRGLALALIRGASERLSA